ncbi:SMI1/KNR4 family protein [Moraxella nonliquefaciens]|jgi:identified by metaGeneAnnotator|uniref:SMI1/KNR4 family protein n=1 Tax=Moraxella nonliquefaciens TaxID=478 RepID=A0A1B8QH72_MORNO|nr:SMI1/KNR4 family protein [Moraxella nonliquefaciens]OBX82486.1 hypothetical protein A7456_07030 [Moraxella nonliquefaciens]QPT44921.1 SMI1/KNR4 family protein [Moraxella nonliquefaciens]QQC29952.1 SMI1/KNR4 family protein [Moraxella nonliquefaciens]
MKSFFNSTMFHKPNPFGSCNMDKIESFERKFSIKIPEDYKEYLLNFNGAKPINKICRLNNDETSIHHMYGLHNIEYCSIDVKNRELFFADDSFGNLFFIDLTQKEEYGFVYFMDHETGKTTFINQSFNKFITSLIGEDVYMKNLKQEYPDIYARIQEFKANPQI